MIDHLAPGFGPLDLDVLDETEQSQVLAHVEVCARCAAEYRLSAEALANLALSLPRSTPSPELRERLLKSVSTTNRFEMFAAQVAELIDVGIDKARELVGRIDDIKAWIATPIEGVFSYDLPVGPAAADAVVGFVRLRSGVVFPDHEHMGDEIMLVVQGGCVDSYGTVMKRGDLIRMPPGTHHDFKARPGPDFIYLGVAKNGFMMFGEHIKPGDPRG
ncbi:MAG TPA: cupin domain-containing protein [Polyangiaceae bacterium]|jgi:anti-sigma factor ChrR (cupin superfamily)|nr:cupin domain-containing protein [Polyangiaceae bacterium]